MKKVCVILPAYNEARNLAVLLPRVFRQTARIRPCELHVLVVDDNSPDGTAEAVRRYMQICSTLHLLTGPKNGLGEAYKRGIAYSVDCLEADLLVQMDADLQHDPELLPRMVRLCEENARALVIASRFAPGASSSLTPARSMLSHTASRLARLCGGLPPVADCTSGFRCFSASLLAGCNLSGLATRGYSFQTALLYELIRNGAQVAEVPQAFGVRRYGDSKLTLRDCLELLRTLAGLSMRRLHYGRLPMLAPAQTQSSNSHAA